MNLLEQGEINGFALLNRTVALNDRFEKQDLFQFVDDDGDNCIQEFLLTSDSNQAPNSSPVEGNPCNICYINPKSVLK